MGIQANSCICKEKFALFLIFSDFPAGFPLIFPWIHPGSPWGSCWKQLRVQGMPKPRGEGKVGIPAASGKITSERRKLRFLNFPEAALGGNWNFRDLSWLCFPPREWNITDSCRTGKGKQEEKNGNSSSLWKNPREIWHQPVIFSHGIISPPPMGFPRDLYPALTPWKTPGHEGFPNPQPQAFPGIPGGGKPLKNPATSIPQPFPLLKSN